MPASQESLLFGLFAWRLGYITQEQLSAALRERLETDSLLPELLVSREYISASTQALLQQLIDQQVERGETGVTTCLTKMGLPTDALESMALTARGDDAPLDTLATQPFGGSGTRKGSSPAATPGTTPKQIGPYKLLHEIGSGGMGTVWLAEQQEPVRRKVALKLIGSGHADEQVIARFEAERQALAMMDHEHIARVYDAGAADDGTPYFVMELVEGDPITAYCDDNKVAVSERLRLFQQACEAVQHAHHKGIIHRDLKPSNILVHEEQGKAKVKVIDFGLAKALQQESRLTDRTLHTEIGQVIGTIFYMSPEQASLDAVDIDTRTDIYSLGVILYELLTGSTPIDRETLKKNAVLKVLEMIREREPAKPSDRLSSSKHNLGSISAQRRIEPVHLHRILRGEVDWIVMKAIDKDRDRRYTTARDLSEDIERYLGGHEIEARPPSARYRVRKFVSRNRVLAVSAAMILTSMLCGVLGSTLYAVRAHRARTAAEKSRVEAERARGDAVVSAKRSREVLDVVRDSFNSIDPNRGADAGMLARDVLVNARHNLKSSALDAHGRIILVDTLTACFYSIGDYETAIELCKEAIDLKKREFGANHSKTINARANLAAALREAGRLEDARPILEEVLRQQKAGIGLLQEATLSTMDSLAQLYHQSGERKQALKLFEELVDLWGTHADADDPNLLHAMDNLAIAYYSIGRFEESLSLITEVVARREKAMGVEHPFTVNSSATLAGVYQALGRLEDALPLFQSTLRLRREKLGDAHPATLNSLNNLAQAYHQLGDLDNAIALIKKAVALNQEQLGPTHHQTLLSKYNLAKVQFSMGQIGETKQVVDDILPLIEDTLGQGHPQAIMTRALLASCHQAQGNHELAIPIFRRLKNLSGSGDRQRVSAMNNLALSQRALGNVEQALATLQETRKLSESAWGPRHIETLVCIDNLAVTLEQAGRFDEARSLFEFCWPLLDESEPDSWRAGACRASYGCVLWQLGKVESAREHLRIGYERFATARDSAPIWTQLHRMQYILKRLIEVAEAESDSDAVTKHTAKLAETQRLLTVIGNGADLYDNDPN